MKRSIVSVLLCIVLLIQVTTTQGNSRNASGRRKKALKWLYVAGYSSKTPDEVEQMSDSQVADAIVAPLQEMHAFYRIPGTEGTLTPEAEEIMEKPRCAQPDEPERALTFAPQRLQRSLSKRIKRYSQLGSEIWISRPVTIGFQNYWTGSISQQEQEDIAINCCRKWAEVSGLSFRFVRNQVANVYIKFAPIPGDSGPYGIVGRAFSPTPRRNPPSSEVHMDDREPWVAYASTGGRGGISLEEGLCHEIGHAIGMGHTNVPNSIMLPSLPGWSHNVLLSSDDRAGVASLYGGYNGQTIIIGGADVQTTTTTSTTTTTTATTTTATTTTTAQTTTTTTTTQPTTTTVKIVPEAPITTTQATQNTDCNVYTSLRDRNRCIRWKSDQIAPQIQPVVTEAATPPPPPTIATVVPITARPIIFNNNNNPNVPVFNPWWRQGWQNIGRRQNMWTGRFKRSFG